MKTLKTIVLCIAISVGSLSITGCGSEMATGAAAGGIAANTLIGLKADLRAREATAMAKMEANVAAIENSNSDTEKILLETENAALRKSIENAQLATGVVEVVEQASTTNWSDPEAVGSLGAAGIATVLAYWMKRKKDAAYADAGEMAFEADIAEKKYSAHKAAMELYSKQNPDAAAKLYEMVGDARAKKGI